MADNKDVAEQEGQLLPAREVMSLISTDPSDGFLPPPAEGGEYTTQPVYQPGPPRETLPGEPTE